MDPIRRSWRILPLLVLLARFAPLANAQVPQTPTGFEPSAVAIRGARLVLAPGKVVETGTLVIRKGLVEAAGPQVAVPVDAEVIDGTGLVVYPGFLSLGDDRYLDDKRLPTPEPGRTVDQGRYALAATASDNRHAMTPEFACRDALASDGDLLSAARGAGLTAIHVVSFRPVSGGQSCFWSLSGLPPREAVIDSQVATAFQLAPPGERAGSPVYPSTLMGSMAHLRQAFLDAERYTRHHDLFARGGRGIPRPADDPVLAALAAVRTGERRALFYAQSRDDIHRALSFAEEQGLEPIIAGGRDAAECIDALRDAGAEVLLTLNYGKRPEIESDPAGEKLLAEIKPPARFQQAIVEEWTGRVAAAARLHEAGIRFAFITQGLDKPDQLLPHVRLAVEQGLPADMALAALTRDAAGILGLESRLGTLQRGKLGHAVALSAPLEEAHSKVRWVIVDGRKFEFNAEEKPDNSGKPGGKAPALDVAGRWQVEITAGEMQTTDAELELTVTDGQLRGSFTSEQGNGRISAGTVQGTKLSFTVAIGAGERTITLQFEGEAAADDTSKQESPNDEAARSDKAAPEAAPQEESPTEDAPRKSSPEKEAPGASVLRKATSLSGTLKTAFGGPARWTARRFGEPAPTGKGDQGPAHQAGNPKGESQTANPVELSIDTSDPPAANAPPQSNGGGSPDARNPDKKPQGNAPQDDQPRVADPRATPPTELHLDRIQRHVETGGDLLVRGGTVLTGAGQTLENTDVLIRAGKIAAIGAGLKPDEGMHVIDAEGRFVIPGLIDTHSHIMIDRGINESSLSIVCEVRIRDVVRSDDPAEYRALAGGLTTARLLHGSANAIGGQDAVVKLKHGRTADEHILHDAPPGVKFALGENVKFRENRFPDTRMGVEATLKRAFFEALDYRRQWRQYESLQARGGKRAEQQLPPRRDLRLEALASILDQELFVHCHCYRADEILMLIRTADELGFRIQSLQHVLEGYKIAPEIVAHGASCSTFSDWWAYKVEAYDATPFNAALLNEAGAKIVIKSDDAELIRHMNLEAAKSLKYGDMPVDDALRMVTLAAAEQLGLGDRIGSIETGKDGDLAIFNEHPFNGYARCETTVIEGEIYFQRDRQPTAMSDVAIARSASPPPLRLAPTEVRQRRVELPLSEEHQYAVTGGTIHPVDAPSIENGILLIAEGRITAVGAAGEIDVPEGYAVVDATGLHVYPGLIDAGSRLGVTEIGKVKETQDFNEGGLFQPDLWAGVAINVDSELIPVSRAGGITAALIQPEGGIIGGQCSLMQTAGWTSAEMVLQEKAALCLRWTDDEKRQKELAEFLEQARLYDAIRSLPKNKQPAVITDPRFEAMRHYLRGEKPVFVEAHSRKQIAAALLMAEKEKLKIVITGGSAAWKLADELKKRNVAVIVGPTMRSPVEAWDPFDATYANPARLHEAGVLFCIRSDHAANSRNAPLEAAIAVAYGLPEEEALKSVTLNAARVLGVDGQLGSLTVGKTASLILTDGSPLQHTTQIKAIFVAGHPFPPASRQTRFYEKYRQRLKGE